MLIVAGDVPARAAARQSESAGIANSALLIAVSMSVDRHTQGHRRVSTRRQCQLGMIVTHLAIQLDQGPVKDWILAPDATTPPKIRLQVDWVRTYAWAGAPASPSAKPSPTKKPSESDN